MHALQSCGRTEEQDSLICKHSEALNEQLGPHLCVPYIDRAVSAGGVDVAIAAPPHAGHCKGVAGHAHETSSSLRIPNLQHAMEASSAGSFPGS